MKEIRKFPEMLFPRNTRPLRWPKAIFRFNKTSRHNDRDFETILYVSLYTFILEGSFFKGVKNLIFFLIFGYYTIYIFIMSSSF